MAFLQIQFFSAALNVASTVNVIFPEAAQGIGIEASGKKVLPDVLYLLHGYSDDHSIWMRRTSVIPGRTPWGISRKPFRIWRFRT